MFNKILIFLVVIATAFPESNQEKYYLRDFKLQRYLGVWYEIMRKDSIYENHLDNAVTTYTLLEDGSFEIVTTGYNTEKKKNTITKGKGKIKYKETENIFEAKFFNLFYKDYIILDYDRENYNYVLVKGPSEEYLWMLSRKPTLDKEIVKKLIKVAEKDGISLENFNYVNQK